MSCSFLQVSSSLRRELYSQRKRKCFMAADRGARRWTQGKASAATMDDFSQIFDEKISVNLAIGNS